MRSDNGGTMLSMIEQRRVRLAETIAWCSLQRLDGSPQESEEIKHRRLLAERSGRMYRSAYLLESRKLVKWFTKRKRKLLYDEARRLSREADVDSIEPLRDQLRTGSLKPDTGFDSRQTKEERAGIVEILGDKRAALLHGADKSVDKDGLKSARGRILIYAPDENLCDGAAKYSSKGFFDDDNIPPWDSWVCFDGRCLVSWVPPLLCQLAEAGIEVNPEGCIWWADEQTFERLFGNID